MKKFLRLSFFFTVSTVALFLFPLAVSAERLDTHEGMMAAYAPLVQAYKNQACTVSASHYLCPGDWFDHMTDINSSSINLWYPITVPVQGDKSSVIFENYWFNTNGSNGFIANADGGTGKFSYNIDKNKWYNCRNPNNQSAIKMPSAITYVDEHNDGHNYNMSETFVSNNCEFVLTRADHNLHKTLYCNDASGTPVMYAKDIPSDGWCINDPTDKINADWEWYRASQAWSTANLHQGLNTVFFAGTDASANYTTGSTPFHYDSIKPIITETTDQSAGTVTISADDDRTPGCDSSGHPNFSGLAYYIYRVSNDGGSTWGAWSGKLTTVTTVQADNGGNCKIDVKAYDNAGNMAEKSDGLDSGTIGDKLIDGLYRVNTDVITSVTVTNNTDKDMLGCPVTFTVAGVVTQSKSVPVPAGSSNLVWFKWHTPSTSVKVTISATAGSGALSSVDCSDSYIYPCNEYTPPNPLSTDRADNGFTVLSPPSSGGSSSLSWGVWDYYITIAYKTVISVITDPKTGKSVPVATQVPYQVVNWYRKSYSASLSATLTVTHDSHCPTAYISGGTWVMRSGYGINENVSTVVTTTSPSDVTPVQRVASFYPEFEYGTYDRLLELMSGGVFQLAANKYSMYNSRVHFMPVWFPNGSYTVQTYALDAWTPAGMLSAYSTDVVNIQDSVFDDWHAGPIWSAQ